MRIKVLPNQSPLEGGGQMALIFYQPLPPGNKVVVYISRVNPNYVVTQQAFEENSMALVCAIPKYPIAEECYVRVFNDNVLLAMTTFTFYQLQQPNSDMMLHLLSNQLQGYFNPMSQSGHGGMGATSGAQGGMGGNYTGYVPSSMYQLLIGACNLGSEPLVHCLLSSPAMSEITTSQLQEAYECAAKNGHSNLADCLQDMVYCHDMTVPGQSMLRARSGDDSPKHVPAYYEALDYLDHGGDSPTEQANKVFQQLIATYQEIKQNHDEEATPTNEAARPLYPTVQVESEQSVETTRQKLGSLNMDDSPSRRQSRTLQHQQSISDEDDSVATLDPPLQTRSRHSLAEQGDEVMPLWDSSYQSQNQRKKGKFSQQTSDADSAIGMSFEEDHQLLSEIQRRRSSALADSIGSANNTISIKLTPEAGLEVANSLEWESAIIVTEDYPPSPDAPKIFYRGDRICQVGDRLVRNMPVKNFAELFQSEAEKGTILGIIPPNTDKVTGTTVSEPCKEPSLSEKSLYRSSSEQSIFTYENFKGKISVLLGIRPSSSAQRKVTIPRTHLGFGLKLIGGKTVGVFVSDVKPEVTQVLPGDQVLEINGHNTQGMTLFDASSLLMASTSDLKLTVVENKGKFSSVKEQVELDSLYLRSLVDHSPTSSRDMHLHKGSLVRVVNTFVYSPNYWLAWLVDEHTGMETQLKRILNPAIAKKQLGRDAYERVERSDVMFHRPVCLLGPDSSTISKELSKKSSFSLCSNVEEVLEVCARGSSHPVIALSDQKQLMLLTALQPIILQTQHSLGGEQTKWNKINVGAILTSDRHSAQADEAERHVLKQQALPVWKQVGVVH